MNVRRKGLAILLTLIALVSFWSCEEVKIPVIADQESELTPGTVIDGQYIVVLDNSTFSLGKTSAAIAMTAASVLNDVDVKNAVVDKVYSNAISGFSVAMSAEDAEAVRTDPRVTLVEPNKVIMFAPPWMVEDPEEPAGQVIPWGIARVGGPVDGTGKTAWVIDSGIDYDHPDLNVDIARSKTFVTRTTTANDDNGHGTHCAGTIAAINNDIGVVGVAAGATLVAVKVLDKRGSGSTDVVIAGIDYVAANAAPGDVANMSLGGGVSDALDLAVVNASNKGIYFSLAAGNESDDANNHSPARANGPYIFTVSAFDNADVFAYFSNYGNPPVDVAAPGVSILSTSNTGGTTTMSGTSMAAPHVAGLLLVTNGNLNYDGYVIDDPDGNPDPVGHN